MDYLKLEGAEDAATLYRRFTGQGLIPLDGGFYPVVHYPGITMYPKTGEEEVFKNYAPPPGGAFSVYAHIPFCTRYCNFCHYPVMTGASETEKDRYLAAISAETALYRRRLGLERPKTTSVLVGGGTPTCLTPAQLRNFLQDLTTQLDFSSCTQFSYDVDPGTLLGAEGAERLKILKDYGVGRLTIGIQSFDDKVLKAMNRAHTALEAQRSIETSRKAGFKLNIEFIYGYPGDTLETWSETMRLAAAADVEEIQVYRIKLIPYGDHAGFFSRKTPAVDIETVFRMKAAAVELLGHAGYRENLRRVFSKDPAEFSRYADDQCCGLTDQLGLGLTAFSSLRDRFILNTQDIKEYYSLISSGRLPVNRGLVRGPEAQAAWALVLPLKNRKVHKSYFKRLTGKLPEELFGGRMRDLQQAGLLTADNRTLELTPAGAFLADEVCHQFYQKEFMPFPPEAYAPGALNPYRE